LGRDYNTPLAFGMGSYKISKKSEKTLADIGYKLSNKGTLYLVGGYLLIAILMLVGVETMLNNVELDPSKFGNISGLIPKTTSHRIFFILLVFSTGICEEIVYRGFAITQLNEIGVNKWIALIIAAFIFIGIHGINAYTNRFFIFIWRRYNVWCHVFIK
jgi:membrane protease YdiL (CAAX protease family)